MRSRASQTPTPTTANPAPTQPLPTFLEHIYELRRRLFWVVATVIAVSALAYSFLGGIIDVLTLPLGNQRLYYLTPIGGLTFIIKLCSFVGILVAVPALMYHLYRYLEPLMGQWRKSALFYVGLSSLFAAIGVAFAYFISLPAALHFLTNFNIGGITAMLTVDSYLSFVMTYLLGAALLFQIPLLLLIINTMTPLNPSKLMKMQRFVVVGAFILAAIISPTPDIMNQTFLALPIIAMYQLGVMMVWLQQRATARRIKREAASVRVPVPETVTGEFKPIAVPLPVPAKPAVTAVTKTTPAARPRLFNDIAVRQTPQRAGAQAAHRPHKVIGPRPAAVVPARQQAVKVPARTIDGFVINRAPA